MKQFKLKEIQKGGKGTHCIPYHAILQVIDVDVNDDDIEVQLVNDLKYYIKGKEGLEFRKEWEKYHSNVSKTSRSFWTFWWLAFWRW